MNTEQLRKIKVGDKVAYRDCMGSIATGIVVAKLLQNYGLAIRNPHSGLIQQVARENIA